MLQTEQLNCFKSNKWELVILYIEHDITFQCILFAIIVISTFH